MALDRQEAGAVGDLEGKLKSKLSNKQNFRYRCFVAPISIALEKTFCYLQGN